MGVTSKKTGRNHRQCQAAGEESCLLQPSSSTSAKPHQAARKSKQYYGDPGGPGATMPLLRPGYEMPPSYETACCTTVDRMLNTDSAVCTITPSDPSAVAFHSYPTAVALQGIPDQVSCVVFLYPW